MLFGFNLCQGNNINKEVKRIYNAHKAECDKYFGRQFKQDNTGDKKYYVYAWRTKSTPPMYFYVGKGSGDRWKHIIRDINNLEAGKLSKTAAARVRRYKEIKDKYDITCDILIDGLTEYESLIYEKCAKLEFEDKGEVILDEEGIMVADTEKDLKRIIAEHEEEYKINSAPVPRIEVDGYGERYLGYENSPRFDKVSEDCLLRTWFYPSFFEHNADSKKREKIISNYVIQNSGKIYSSNKPSTKTASIIVQGRIPQEAFIRYKQQGLQIYSADDVIEYISKTGKTVSDKDLRVTPEVDAHLKKVSDTTDYIVNLLVQAGANERDIIRGKYKDEVQLEIAGRGFVSFLCYKKKPGGVVTVPLDYASPEIRQKLTRITSWKGDFVYTELSELQDIMPFFKSQVKRRRFTIGF